MSYCEECGLPLQGETINAETKSCAACTAAAMQGPSASQPPAPPAWTAEVTTARARILRYAPNGDGLLSVNGHQHPFSLERHWRSDHVPATGMTVDALFTPEGELLEVHPVMENTFSQEKMQAKVEEARVLAEKTLTQLKTSGVPVVQAATGTIIAKIGMGNLIALAALMIGWFGFNTLSIRLTQQQQIGFTFYDMLRAMNNLTSIDQLGDLTHASAGFYGFLCYLALAFAIAPFFISIKKSWLGLMAPLVFMLMMCIGVYWKISSSVSSAMAGASSLGGNEFADMASGIAREMAAEMLKAMSLGLGFYLSIAAALYLAWKGFQRFRSV